MVRDTHLKVEYWRKITREFFVLLVETAGIFYMI